MKRSNFERESKNREGERRERERVKPDQNSQSSRQSEGLAGTDQIVGNPSTEVKRISILAIFHTNGAAPDEKTVLAGKGALLCSAMLCSAGCHDWAIMAAI